MKNLSQGKHFYQYELDRRFFDAVEGDEVKKGDVKVDLVITKTISTFDFDFDIKGVVQVPCSRCLDDLEQNIDTKNKLIVKFGSEYSEESDEVVIIPEDEGEINIAWFLYEFIALSIPIKRVHEPGKCNKAMSAKYNKHRAVNKDEDDEDGTIIDDEVDYEEEREDSTDTADPRWNALKGLSFEDN